MSLFANKMIQALCWTLFHSLWQALVLAFIAGAVIMCTKRSAVVMRYNLLTGLLVAFLLTAAGTFYYEAIQVKQPAAEIILVTGDKSPFAGMDIQTGETTSASHPVSSAIISFLNSNSRIIVLAWLCIIAFKCFQLFIGFWGIYKLKRTQTAPAGEYWTARIKELAEMLYIDKPIQIIQSAIAKVPMVTGHFKPVILLPMGILTSLPADEIEAILLHELAHIRRRDFLVNVLQSFCDILFFFNPAVLWVSGLIKEERENCCDDIALKQVKNKKKFVHALIAFQEYHSPELAVTFAGKRQHLLNRVKRILTNNNKTLNAMEKLLLVTGLVITSFVVVAFTHNNAKPVVKKKQAVVDAVSFKSPELMPKEILFQDTVPPKKKEASKEKEHYTISEDLSKDRDSYTISSKKNDKNYRIKVENDKITELYIDDKKIPDDKIDDHKAEVDDIIKETKERWIKARNMAEEARERADKHRAEAHILREKMANQMDDMKRSVEEMEAARSKMHEQRKISAEELQRLKEKMMEDQKYTIEERRLAKKAFDDHLAMAKEEKVIAEKYRSEAERSYRDVKRIHEREKMQRLKEADRVHAKAELFKIRAEKQRMVAQERRERAEVSRKKSQQLVKDIMDDLTKEGVVKDSDDDVAFTLDNDALYVNGKKQPDALHQKLVKKYLKSNGDHIRYTVSANSSHTDIHVEKQ